MPRPSTISPPLIAYRSNVSHSRHGDEHINYEFYGPIGVSAIMLCSPLLLYYIWICLWFFDGKLQGPRDLGDTPSWLMRMWSYVRQHAAPTPQAVSIYGGLMGFQLLLAYILPGYPQEGLPIESLGGKRLLYNCNALGAWYTTLALSIYLHSSGLFSLTILIDRFGEIMTVAQISGFLVAAVCYVWAIKSGTAVRMSNNVVYDYFMGAALNPRIGPVDIKMWAEVRIPWILLFLYSLAGAAKQFEMIGYVSSNQAFMILGTGLYVNACAKGEELIPQTWDIAHEKFGWLLAFWNLAGVPFTYCCSIIYMCTRDPVEYYLFPTWAHILLYAIYFLAYFVWDSSMAQKSRFKMEQAGNFRPRNTFPQMPWSRIEDPRYLQTTRGRLLIDGWWAYLRKPNYTADMVQALCWGVCAGFKSPLPYWYPMFFFIMIIHRCGRDYARCARKYGKYWDEYCRIVPYSFIYGLY